TIRPCRRGAAGPPPAPEHVTAEVVAQALVSGLLMGCVYALIAAGLSLIFAMFAAFWGWALGGLDPLLTLPLVTTALFGVGWVVYKGVIRRILGAPMLAQIFATFGLAVFLRSGAQFLWSPDFRLVQAPWAAGRLSIFGLFVGTPQRVAALAALAACALLYAFVTRTETGLALQATAQDRQAAALMGIDTERMLALGWGLGAGCVGVAGALLANFFYVFPDVGTVFGLLAYVTVALGGFGNVPATLLGGVLIGLVETAVGLWAPAFKYVGVFCLYLLVVLWRPQGLLGRA